MMPQISVKAEMKLCLLVFLLVPVAAKRVAESEKTIQATPASSATQQDVEKTIQATPASSATQQDVAGASSNESTVLDHDSVHNHRSKQLKVWIESARDLKGHDWFTKSDPYCVGQFLDGSNKPKGKKIKTDTLHGVGTNPEWNFGPATLEYNGEPKIRFEVHDKDIFSDDLMGHAELNLKCPYFNGELTLNGGGSIKVRTQLEHAAPVASKTPRFLQALSGCGPDVDGKQRDYTIIVDRSGSMNKKEKVVLPDSTAALLHKEPGEQMISRWEQTEGALELIAPLVAKEDPDCASLLLFSTNTNATDPVCSAEEVKDIFEEKWKPYGWTYLAPALKEAMKFDADKPQTIIVLTDGKATDVPEVKKVLIEATQKLSDHRMLSVSFIQVGLDKGAKDFLHELDHALHDSHVDIVDTMAHDDMGGKSFMEIIEQSLQ